MSAVTYLCWPKVRRRVGGTLVRAWHLKQWGVGRVFKTLPWNIAKFLLFDREVTNFTYSLRNREELIRFLEHDLGFGPMARTYADELENDTAFRTIIETAYSGRADRNRVAKFGRRLGWYVIVRATKPKVIFETGTHDGLGAAIFSRALEQNAKEGHRGTLYTFDIDPTSGWLVGPELRRQVGFVRGDLQETLPKTLAQLGATVDLFIHDSLHTYEHEKWELETVAPHMSGDGVIMSDNAHATDALKDHCTARGLSFHYWREKPRAHPHPGAGIGYARVRARV